MDKVQKYNSFNTFSLMWVGLNPQIQQLSPFTIPNTWNVVSSGNTTLQSSYTSTAAYRMCVRGFSEALCEQQREE
jgi:hypothetical protein